MKYLQGGEYRLGEVLGQEHTPVVYKRQKIPNHREEVQTFSEVVGPTRYTRPRGFLPTRQKQNQRSDQPDRRR